MKFTELPTPCYLLDENRLVQNLAVLRDVARRTGAKILLAQKAFSMFSVYPLIREYLAGTTASGLYEARLGHEEFGGETHVYAPAYAEGEFREILEYADHIVFNSFTQWKAYGSLARAAGKSCGLRLNPECSTQGEHAIYDPCAPGSRLGVTIEKLEEELRKNPGFLEGVDGFHFHTLCEQNSDDLETTLEAVERKFGKYLYDMKWLNMGGGHHITRKDYDVERLVRLVNHMKEKYQVQVYLEPGEAVALNAGYLKTTVLDIVENAGITTLILDASAACHMPDVLEMPYRPPLKDSGEPGKKQYTYRLSSYTCLAGDIIGDYSFDREIQIGDTLYFEDMAIYSMVKNNTFNGIGLPDIVLRHENGECEVVKHFGYEDFKGRLS